MLKVNVNRARVGLIIIISIPIRATRSLMEENFREMSLVASQVVIMFFQRMLTSIIRPRGNATTCHYNILRQAIRSTINTPFIVNTTAHCTQQAYLRVVLVFTIRRRRWLIFGSHASREDSMNNAIIAITNRLVILCLVANGINVKDVRVNYAFRLVHAALYRNISNASYGPTLASVGKDNKGKGLFRYVRESEQATYQRIQTSARNVVRDNSIRDSVELTMIASAR